MSRDMPAFLLFFLPCCDAMHVLTASLTRFLLQRQSDLIRCHSRNRVSEAREFRPSFHHHIRYSTMR